MNAFSAQADAGQQRDQWFALRVRSNCERTVAVMLQGKGYTEFLPTYRKPSRSLVRNVELPLFPGYVFSRFDITRRLPILTTPGVVHVVGFGQKPEPINEDEISAIQRFVASGLVVEPWPFLQVGDTVVVECGALAGLEGILVEKKNQYRMVVSLTLLRRSVAVEIDRDWIRPTMRAPLRVSAGTSSQQLRHHSIT
jgi:transcription antitermination factor NusG